MVVGNYYSWVLPSSYTPSRPVLFVRPGSCTGQLRRPHLLLARTARAMPRRRVRVQYTHLVEVARESKHQARLVVAGSVVHS
jgi:hypothetical protein